ncbi:alcohol dehydrogenase [Egicoccus halophilus]|uniref:Alcohol dehydrogenase n=2 Tax=Egicoccus halophilus TaxID=1670830 RepID=A0A8J3AA35_9ACTN|nr:alcohol dehydrogenase [Egicoccus halophilus]
MLRSPGNVLFGRGVATTLGSETARLARRVLVVVDRHVQDLAAVQDVVATLADAGVEHVLHPSEELEFGFDSADAPARRYETEGCDAIVAIGGGSALDLGKLVGIRVTHPGSLGEYIGEAKVPGPIPPVVAVPTTAGTGSEVTPVAVLTDEERGSKVGVSSRHLVPTLALVDPGLTDTCPAGVTAAAGIDALCHAVEAFTARDGRTPADLGVAPTGFIGKAALSDALALEAIRAIGTALAVAVNDPTRDARDRMAYGSLLAGLAFGQAGTGTAHAIQYPVGYLTRTPHGVGTGLLLPYAMAYNRPVRTRELARVAEALGADADTDADTGASNAVRMVEHLCRSIGLPPTLRELGVREVDLPAVVDGALAARRLLDNNGRVMAALDVTRVVHAAWHGELADLLADASPAADGRAADGPAAEDADAAGGAADG